VGIYADERVFPTPEAIFSCL